VVKKRTALGNSWLGLQVSVCWNFTPRHTVYLLAPALFGTVKPCSRHVEVCDSQGYIYRERIVIQDGGKP
jgi:hypothetical protein